VVDVRDIQGFFRGRIVLAEPLARMTSFRIGGPADYYIEPADREDLVAVLAYLRDRRVPYVVLGCGSNVLVSDSGIRGAVINLEHGLARVSLEDRSVKAESGVRLGKFVDFCIHHGLGGVEMLAGIPGTVGGGVVMNAGAYGGEVSDHLHSVEVIRQGAVLEVKKADAGFAYRRSNFIGDVVLSARFALPDAEKAELIRRRRELLLKRNRTQPLNLPNSGSVFQNPPGNFAAKLIEECGLKGKRCGAAQISEKHANFIVNHGGALASDVLELILLARRSVRERSGIALEPEVKLLGFPEDVNREVHS
jgi:UDP-N-acetylmuramate dehydrogenase